MEINRAYPEQINMPAFLFSENRAMLYPILLKKFIVWSMVSAASAGIALDNELGKLVS